MLIVNRVHKYASARSLRLIKRHGLQIEVLLVIYLLSFSAFPLEMTFLFHRCCFGDCRNVDLAFWAVTPFGDDYRCFPVHSVWRMRQQLFARKRNRVLTPSNFSRELNLDFPTGGCSGFRSKGDIRERLNDLS